MPWSEFDLPDVRDVEALNSRHLLLLHILLVSALTFQFVADFPSAHDV
jgi:hypothetical protein